MSSLKRVRLAADLRRNSIVCAIVAAFVLCVLSGTDLLAQDPTAPLPVPSSDLKSTPTGQFATFAGVREKNGPMQPVEWKLPKGAIAEVAQQGGFVSDPTSSNVFALQVGAVYRFRLTNFELLPGATIYPTLELVGRMNPPLGKAWDFPIEISVPTRDVEAALNGALITRVVFVENAANPSNVDSSEDPERMTLDVPAGIDPVTAASTRGRVVAILRLGSRGPEGDPNAEDPFFFGLPPFEFKPASLQKEEAPTNLTPSDVDALADPSNVK